MIDLAGVCFVCGCTAVDPCLVTINTVEGGTALMPCAWANEDQTLCTNPDCLEEAFRCPICGIAIGAHTVLMEAGCGLRQISGYPPLLNLAM